MGDPVKNHGDHEEYYDNLVICLHNSRSRYCLYIWGVPKKNPKENIYH